MDTPTCYYLARAVGRPVRMVLTNPEELTQANPGHPSIIKLRTGVKKDGRIWARQAEVLSDGGAYCGFVPRPAPKVTDPADVCGPYRIPHILLQSTMVYTNNVPCGNYRGPGAPQAFFAGESQLDIICRELGLDPIELRIQNALHDEDLAPDGERWLDFRLDQALELAREASGWDPTAQRPPNSGRGVAVSFYSTGVGVSGTDLELNAEGRVKVTTGTPDTGTGSHTVLQQIVAEVLSLPPDQIEVRAGHTNEAQPDSGSGADRVTHIAGRATQLAAEQLREQLQELAAEYLGCPPAAVELVDGQARDRERPGQAIAVAELAARAASGGQPLTASASFSSAEVVGNKTVSAYIIDVSVDPESGQVRLTHLTAVHDVGTVIHPVNLEGQLEGGMVMGFGYALSETLPVEDGRVTAGSLAEYKIACQQDIPSLTMRLITDAPGPGPYGAKGIGELVPGALPAAIANAVHDAIGVRILDLPITAEKIRAQLTQPPPKRLPSVSATSGADRS
jgi:CO/xanthine dehydrogenase Mo-binding subunit